MRFEGKSGFLVKREKGSGIRDQLFWKRDQESGIRDQEWKCLDIPYRGFQVELFHFEKLHLERETRFTRFDSKPDL
jgi:hypothetical protein